MVLQDTVERLYAGNLYAEEHVGLYLVRGENVLLLGEIVSALFNFQTQVLLLSRPLPFCLDRLSLMGSFHRTSIKKTTSRLLSRKHHSTKCETSKIKRKKNARGKIRRVLRNYKLMALSRSIAGRYFSRGQRTVVTKQKKGRKKKVKDKKRFGAVFNIKDTNQAIHK